MTQQCDWALSDGLPSSFVGEEANFNRLCKFLEIATRQLKQDTYINIRSRYPKVADNLPKGLNNFERWRKVIERFYRSAYARRWQWRQTTNAMNLSLSTTWPCLEHQALMSFDHEFLSRKFEPTKIEKAISSFPGLVSSIDKVPHWQQCALSVWPALRSRVLQWNALNKRDQTAVTQALFAVATILDDVRILWWSADRAKPLEEEFAFWVEYEAKSLGSGPIPSAQLANKLSCRWRYTCSAVSRLASILEANLEDSDVYEEFDGHVSALRKIRKPAMLIISQVSAKNHIKTFVDNFETLVKEFNARWLKPKIQAIKSQWEQTYLAGDPVNSTKVRSDSKRAMDESKAALADWRVATEKERRLMDELSQLDSPNRIGTKIEVLQNLLKIAKSIDHEISRILNAAVPQGQQFNPNGDSQSNGTHSRDPRIEVLWGSILDRPGIAIHIARLLADYNCDHPALPPVDLIAAAVLSRYAQPRDESLARVLKQHLEQTKPEELSRHSSEIQDSFNLMLFSATLCSAFVAPESRAASLLSKVQLQTQLSPVKKLAETIAGHTNRLPHNVQIDAALIAAMAAPLNPKRWSRQFESTRARADDWLTKARKLPITYAPDRLVWRHMLKETGYLGKMATLLARGDASQRNEIDSLRQKLVDEQSFAVLVNASSYDVSQMRVGARSYRQFHSFFQPLLHIAKSWLRMVDANSQLVTNAQRKKILSLDKAVHSLGREAIATIKSISDNAHSRPLQTSCELAKQAITNLCGLFKDGCLHSRSYHTTPDTILSQGLLFVTALDINRQYTPTGDPKEILELLTQNNGHSESLHGAFSARLRREDLVGAELACLEMESTNHEFAKHCRESLEQAIRRHEIPIEDYQRMREPGAETGPPKRAGIRESDSEKSTFKAASQPVTVREPTKSDRGHQIPPRRDGQSQDSQRGQVELDPGLLQKKKAETQRAASVLEDVFRDRDADPSSDGAGPGGEGQSPPLEGLDDLHQRLLWKLISRPAWSQDEFRELADEFGLMPSGALETLNEWAFERFGKLLIEEDGDMLRINEDLAAELREGDSRAT